jgi:uncharacterized protein
VFKKVNSKLNNENAIVEDAEYRDCVSLLIENEKILSMDAFIQHSDITCLDHCIYVSYMSYRLCKKLRFDYCSAARGAMLHDFFLYDWHKIKPYEGLHGFHHSKIALRNANEHFELTDMEKDIIHKHMWPLTSKVPKYKESLIVLLVDKYCATTEILRIAKKKRLMVKAYKDLIIGHEKDN